MTRSLRCIGRIAKGFAAQQGGDKNFPPAVAVQVWPDQEMGDAIILGRPFPGPG
jgi:hypothetical protein